MSPASMKGLPSSCKVPDIFARFQAIYIFSTIFVEVPSIKFHGNPSHGGRADTCGQTDRNMNGQNEENEFFAVMQTRLKTTMHFAHTVYNYLRVSR